MKEDRKNYYLKNKENILAIHKKWLENNPEYMKEYNKKYYIKNKEHYKEYCQEHKEHRKEYMKQWDNKNKEYIREYVRKRGKKFRIEVLNIISNNNPHCIRCGCDDIKLLEINHKNGGGTKELQNGKLMTKFYRNIHEGIRKTDDLEILCRICNARHYLELKYGKLPYKISYDKILHGEEMKISCLSLI
jgi:hypothetical protein